MTTGDAGPVPARGGGAPRRGLALLLAGVAVAGGVGATAWRMAQTPKPPPPPGAVYTAQGYGGFVAAPKRPVTPTPGKPEAAVAAARRGAMKAAGASASSSVERALAAATAAYKAGRYREAEAEGSRVIAASLAKSPASPLSPAPDASRRLVSARARHLMAFSAARRRDLATARERFAQVEKAAAGLPRAETDAAVSAAAGGAPAPALAEDAAYQHAVCTLALGDKAGAEAEWVAFMKRYPDSPLVHASMRRIARLHGGNIPAEVEAVWRGATKVARERERERDRQNSLCGPRCLAELLRRKGGAAEGDPEARAQSLAREMKTDEHGTTLLALQGAARRHGYPRAQGVSLTAAGFQGKVAGTGGAATSAPLIALIQPGHFVLVEGMAADGAVTVWDPNVPGAGGTRGGRRTFAAADWARRWATNPAGDGLALTLGGGAAAVAAAE